MGDLPGHEFHGNQYGGSVLGVLHDRYHDEFNRKTEAGDRMEDIRRVYTAVHPGGQYGMRDPSSPHGPRQLKNMIQTLKTAREMVAKGDLGPAHGPIAEEIHARVLGNKGKYLAEIDFAIDHLQGPAAEEAPRGVVTANHLKGIYEKSDAEHKAAAESAAHSNTLVPEALRAATPRDVQILEAVSNQVKQSASGFKTAITKSQNKKRS